MMLPFLKCTKIEHDAHSKSQLGVWLHLHNINPRSLVVAYQNSSQIVPEIA